MADNKDIRKLSSFSVILIMVTLMIIGVFMLPMLNIQYAPQLKQKTFRINYSWPNASARVIESEVTSRIEGVLGTMSGVEKIESESHKEYGVISVYLKKETDIDAARFEVASLIKQIYGKLPQGVTYPTFSTGVSGVVKSPIMTYTINSPLSTSQIESYSEQYVIPLINEVEGVNDAVLTGAVPYEWVISFNSDICSKLNIYPDDIRQALSYYFNERNAGLADKIDNDGNLIQLRVVLSNRTDDSANIDWESIVIKKADDRIITLGDIAKVQYQEALPTSYFRINGRNNINLNIYAEDDVNTLKVSDRIKEVIDKLNETENNFDFILSNDTSERIRSDLHKIYLRTIMSLLILLGFVYLVSRKWRYLLVITITLAANILVAFIFYNLFNIELHLYSLAGITVSLGLIIDTSIIMVDHYNYYHDRKAFLAILAALLTTIGSLSIVFFLPEDTKANLVDFSAVIIINLTVSLIIALLFVPALLDKLPIGKREETKLLKQRRRIVKFTRYYKNFIVWNKRHKWVLILLFIFGFGIPLYLLPEKIEYDKEDGDKTHFWANLYNKTIGGSTYQESIKPIIEPVFGGSMRLFAKTYQSASFRMPERTTLHIMASMPEGCTIYQLNDLILKMENFLSQYKEIDIYQTYISSYRNGSITVTFNKDSEYTGFPLFLEQAAISEAINLGGADWRIYGQGQGFSNALNSGYKSSRIKLTGYNYEQLYRYAEELIDTLSQNRRVSDPVIYANEWYNATALTEYYLDFDYEKFGLYNIPLVNYYAYLQNKLYNQQLPSILNGMEVQPVRLVADSHDSYDVWNLENDIVNINDSYMRLSEFGSIEKRQMGNDIFKVDQQYQLIVAYDFIGAYELNRRVMEKTVDNLNDRLPLGYKASEATFGMWQNQKTQYALLLLIIVIIYFVCAILFESLIQPFVITIMIPISFIGVFLTFSLFDFPFDQGGFASFVLLCGIVVNAGIYIINEYNIISRRKGWYTLNNYLQAYNHKIIPIMLTIISTVLGLIPFVYDGKDEVFWFSFAVGAMGGMIFSIIALVVYLPVFLPVKRRSHKNI